MGQDRKKTAGKDPGGNPDGSHTGRRVIVWPPRVDSRYPAPERYIPVTRDHSADKASQDYVDAFNFLYGGDSGNGEDV